MKQKHLETAIDLWEAWIEFDHVSDNSFGTLYIIGEAKVSIGTKQPLFIKKWDDNIPGRINLHLQTITGTGRLTEIIYAEPVTKLDLYKSVAIYCDGELVTQINNIEILV
jgi:hypothetical protein